MFQLYIHFLEAMLLLYIFLRTRCRRKVGAYIKNVNISILERGAGERACVRMQMGIRRNRTCL